MDTVHLEDECQTAETSVCRILPGKLIKSKKYYPNDLITFKKISMKPLLKKSLITRNAAMMKKVCLESRR